MADADRSRDAYARLVARAWSDPAFKATLLADPHGALAEAGVRIPAGVTVQVVENTDKKLHLVLPAKPSGELTDEALEKLAGGNFYRPGLPVEYG